MKLDWKRTDWTWRGTVPQWAWHYTIEKDVNYSVYTVRFNPPNGEPQELGSQYTLAEAKQIAKDHAAQRWATR